MRAQQARSIQPLPGGIEHYSDTLAALIRLCEEEGTADEFIARLMQEYPTVRTESVARSCLYNVLCVLDLVQTENAHLTVTPEGRAFLLHQDPVLLERQLRTHVTGVEQLIEELRTSARPIGQLLAAMQERGYGWESDWQLRFRLRWLRVAGLVERRTERESSSRYPEWALVREPVALPTRS